MLSNKTLSTSKNSKYFFVDTGLNSLSKKLKNSFQKLWVPEYW